MINYKLAKELKDAGFPLQETPYNAMPVATFEGPVKILKLDTRTTLIEIDGTVYLLPILNELIEACGDEFESLDKDVTLGMDELDIEYHKWAACGKIEAEVYGSTKEEAVARLWLKLNKDMST